MTIPSPTMERIKGRNSGRLDELISVTYSEVDLTRFLGFNPKNRVRSTSEYVTLMSSSNLPELRPFIRSMVGLGVVISFLVVLLNMHTMVLERTREVGILKALGFSRLDLVRIRLGERLVLT